MRLRIVGPLVMSAVYGVAMFATLIITFAGVGGWVDYVIATTATAAWLVMLVGHYRWTTGIVGRTHMRAYDDGYVSGFTEASTYEDRRLALIALAATQDASLLGEGDDRWEIQDLFEHGILRTSRDITDEYVTILTAEGREFVQRSMGEVPA